MTMNPAIIVVDVAADGIGVVVQKRKKNSEDGSYSSQSNREGE
jgi:hypothetical protein